MPAVSRPLANYVRILHATWISDDITIINAKDDNWLENKLDIIVFIMWKYARTKKLKNPEIQSEIHLIIWKALLSTLKKKNISPVSQSLVIKYLQETLRWEISYFLKAEMPLERIKLVPLFIFSAKNKLSKHVSSLLWKK